MAKYVGEISQPTYRFDFSQREIDLLISIIYDLTNGFGLAIDGRAYVPNSKTKKDLEKIKNALSLVGMSVSNDYLSNFDEEA